MGPAIIAEAVDGVGANEARAIVSIFVETLNEAGITVSDRAKLGPAIVSESVDGACANEAGAIVSIVVETLDGAGFT